MFLLKCILENKITASDLPNISDYYKQEKNKADKEKKKIDAQPNSYNKLTNEEIKKKALTLWSQAIVKITSPIKFGHI